MENNNRVSKGLHALIPQNKDMDPRHAKVFQKMKEFKEKGYIIDKLEEALTSDIDTLEKHVEEFERDIKRLGLLEKKLNKLDDSVLGDEIAAIREKLKDPSKLASLAREISQLERRAKDTSASEKNGLKGQLEAWKTEGYVVSTLETALSGSTDGAKAAFSNFEKGIEQLKGFEARLNAHDTSSVPQAEALRTKLKDPTKLEEITKEFKEIEDAIKNAPEAASVPSASGAAAPEAAPKKVEDRPKEDLPYDERQRISELQPSLTFDKFVTGDSNRFAQAAALAVARAPSSAYNPLFLYGGPGLGKTHLQQAIGNMILANHPEYWIMYISSEKFTNDLLDSISEGTLVEFRERYRNLDVLLIDDIQFLAGKDSTQEEFFHTFNSLYNAHKQIVICSDRPPKEIPTLEERLVSRFEMGLIADVKMPNFETRLVILRRKAESLNLKMPEEVLNFIAENIKLNIRELEGCLNKVTAYSTMMNQEVTIELTSTILKDVIPEEVGGAFKPEAKPGEEAPAQPVPAPQAPAEPAAEPKKEPAQEAPAPAPAATPPESESADMADDPEERQNLRNELLAWKKEGYNVNRLEKVIEGDLTTAWDEFTLFMDDVESLKSLRERLSNLSTKGYEDEFRSIEKKIYDPDQAEAVEKEIIELERKIKEKEMAAKEDDEQRKDLLNELEDWKKEGYNISRLEKVLEGDISKAWDVFTGYMEDVENLNKLKDRLSQLDTKDFEKEAKEIQQGFTDPDRVKEISEKLEALEEKSKDAKAKEDKDKKKEPTEKEKSEVEELLNQGREASRIGDYKVALELYNKVMAEAPDHKEAKFLKKRAEAKLGETKKEEIKPKEKEKPKADKGGAECSSCGGSKKCYWCDGQGKCDRCGGSGKEGAKECSSCGGTGKCTSCNGTGKCYWCAT